MTDTNSVRPYVAATSEHETSGDRLAQLIDPAAQMTCLGGGYEFTEGPVWLAAGQQLLFNDIPGDRCWRWSMERGIELVREPTFKANGMALDNDGLVVVCEQLSSCVTRRRDGGERELLAFHYRGRYLNSPNDLVTRAADGSIYFTDPASGRKDDWIGQQRSRDLDFQGVYRIPPGGGELELVVDEREFQLPNGLCFSPDGQLLYINDSLARLIKVYDVDADGSLSGGRVLHSDIGTGVPGQGNVDGMECDELGNIWVTGLGGVWVLSPDGQKLGVIETPEVCGSLCWGGADLHTLFLTTSTTVHSIPTIVGPAPLPPL